MTTNPEANPDYNLQNVTQLRTHVANKLLNDKHNEEIVSCKPLPGAETMPPNKINLAPHMTVKVYELEEERTNDYILITALPSGGMGPGDILIDRAISFTGEVIDMLDHLLISFDDADWSRGIKKIDNIQTQNEVIIYYLNSISQMLEEQADSRYALDLWEDYLGHEPSPEDLPTT